jgi:CubicO group peptidase (beta-lactamase class C family)
MVLNLIDGRTAPASGTPMPTRLSRFVALLCLTATFGPSLAAEPSAGADANPAALERTLLPTVLLEGFKPWTLEERMRHYRVPGVSIALIQRGRVAWARGYGVLDLTSKAPVTPRSLFQAASITKPVTAMAVLRLAEQGKLSLTAPVNSLLRSWKLPEGPFTSGVTLERVLSHTAGLTVGGFPGYPPGATLPTLLQILEGRSPANSPPVRVDVEPGTKFRYSGGGYEIAQQILIDQTAQPFPAFVADTVLGPAGMADSFFLQPLSAELAARAASGHAADGSVLPGRWRVYPELAAAGLWTTPTDLARLAIAVQQSRAGAKGALLSREMITRMLTASVEQSGLGFFLDQRGKGTFEYVTSEQPSGTEGFKALLVASVQGGYGVVVMANGDGGAKLADEIVRGAAEVYGWKELAVPRMKRGRITEAQLQRLSGRYRIGSDDLITISPGKGVLQAKPVLGDPFELVPVGGTVFMRLEPPMRYFLDVAGVIIESPVGELNGLRVGAGESIPLELLLAGKAEAALEAYRALKQADGADPSVSEPRLNDLGYELQARAPDAALTIFRLSAELYPDSSNSWDSLAEALLAAGKKDEAMRCYRKVLEVVPRDTHLSADIKAMLQRNAQNKLGELERR